jgi:cytochrome c biogenesis protein CcmG/thiol:disulfide interchange protein DsbE
MFKNIHPIAIALIGLSLFILVVYFVLSNLGGFESSGEGLMAPDFSLSDYDGSLVSLSDFDNQPLIINSWATWCPFCVKELDDFATVQKAFGDDIKIIAINRKESLEKSRSFTDSLGVTDDLIFLMDEEDSFYRSINGFAMPETIFVDRDGKIMFHKRGSMDVAEIINKSKELLIK